MKTAIILLAVTLLSACTSFKAGQFGACIVTGKATCEVKNDQAVPAAEVVKK